MPVTLRQLRYFQALVEHGSFSRAAESVHVSQPALSLQIRELEASLGGPVVERESRGIQLTRLGREAHEQTLRILDETLLLETMGKRFEEGPLRFAVGILSTLAPYLLPGLLDRLEDSSPRVELNVMEASGQDLVAHLLAGRLDAAIVSLPLGLLELPERELFEDRFLLAGRARRLEALGAPNGAPQPADLAQADVGPLLTLGDGHCLANQVLGACSMWRIQEVRRGAGSLATLSRLVASGAGLTLMPETAALCERSASPELSFLRFRSPEPARQIGLAHRAVYHGQRWVDLLVEAASDAGEALVQEARESIRKRSRKR
ncbi:MAG: LysR substrate-binding domain-containing protein [Defluviicoccus sp.]|nr:LysR substrate-binding domain-containing protein [Defluviicoccus sp.]MDE0275356.1 LysR substrate-binding domain-containing protein [Defluviicoccus sp.]